jgi:hypothetical protein
MSQEIFYWLIVLFIVAALWGAWHLVDYLLQEHSGELVISNKQPLPGNKIVKQENMPEAAPAEEPVKAQPNRQTEGSPKSPNSK